MSENNNIVIYQSEDGKVHLDVVYNEEKKLSKQAKNSDVNIFAQNIFPKVFEKIAQDFMYNKWMPLQNSLKNHHSMVK